MINYRLDPFNLIDQKTKYDIVSINSNNIETSINLIHESIILFNNEVTWNDMYDLQMAIERIKNGMVMYVGINEDGILGYVWFNDYLDGRLMFNLFIKNKTDNKTYSGKSFVSDIINRFENNVKIYSEVDDWNIKSIRLFDSLGFKKYLQ